MKTKIYKLSCDCVVMPFNDTHMICLSRCDSDFDDCKYGFWLRPCLDLDWSTKTEITEEEFSIVQKQLEFLIGQGWNFQKVKCMFKS